MNSTTTYRALAASLAFLTLAGADGVGLTAEPSAAEPQMNAAQTVTLTPADDVQKALDAAAPGDTIALKDGVYYLSLRITRGGMPGKPITLRAVNGGAATISGAAPEFLNGGLTFEPSEGGSYTAAVPWSVGWIMVNDRRLHNYADRDKLMKREITAKGKTAQGTADGYFWEKGVLHVRLDDGKDPNQQRVEIPRSGVTCNIEISTNDVTIEGLRLRLGVNRGLHCKGNRITVRDCFIDGTTLGIDGNGEDFLVEYCEYSGVPGYEWLRRYGLRNYEVATFMNHRGPRAALRHNFSYGSFDGIGFHSGGGKLSEDLSDISGNLLMDFCDDGIEFDSYSALNLRVHHNIIMDGMCMLALTPVLGGNLLVDHNIFYVSPEKGMDWCVLFKFGNPWQKLKHMPTTDTTIVHNTMVNQKRWIYWGGEDCSYSNNVLENNIFYVRHSRGSGIRDFPFGRHNLYAGPAIAPTDIPEFIHARDAGFVSMEPMDFRLREDSPAVDAGVTHAAGRFEKAVTPENKATQTAPPYLHTTRGKAPDLGAIELGDAWEFTPPGPRWGSWTTIPVRPSFPASFDPSWAGFEPGAVRKETKPAE